MKSIYPMLIAAVLLLANGCTSDDALAAQFKIHRGVNTSHWLSQTEIRGAEREAYMTEKDFANISALGFDHVRIPIDEMHFWSEDGIAQPEAFKLLHNGIQWSLKHNLRVIVDLHVLRSHHFNDADNRQLWEDKDAQETFIGFWQKLSAELDSYPLDKVAYEPLNEAVSDNPEDWNNLINWVISEIRKLEPHRVIVMGSNNWQQVGTFKDLKVPENDPNIILSFHYYIPFALTHYKAWWNPFSAYDGPVEYPGQSIDTTLYAAMDPELLEVVKWHNGYFDLEGMERDMMQAVSVAQQFGLPIYCGEWGAFPSTDIAIRQRWYRDMISIFEKHNVAWAHWNYKNDFPLVSEKTLEPIDELLNIMLP